MAQKYVNAILSRIWSERKVSLADVNWHGIITFLLHPDMVAISSNGLFFHWNQQFDIGIYTKIQQRNR